MTLFEFLQKVKEENDRNLKYSSNIALMKEKYEAARTKSLKFAREQVENDEITIDDFAKINKKINREIVVALEHLEEVYPIEWKYSEMLSRLKDCGAFISNKMMCNLLKTQTGTKWKYEIVEESPIKAKLFFSNDLGEKFCTQKGILEQGGNLAYVVKKLENINWFRQYLEATRFEDNELLESTLMTGQKGFLFPPFIQITLENFFKHIKVDPNHPEHLIFEDHRFDKSNENNSTTHVSLNQSNRTSRKFTRPDGK